MSFGGGTQVPEVKPRLANLREERTSSNQAARLLPVFWGRRLCAGQFISKLFNRSSKTRKRGSGGKGSPKVGAGTDRWASWAMAFCSGPVEGIRELWFDQQLVWSGHLDSSGGTVDHVDITVDGYGIFRLYFGGSAQTADPHLTSTTLPQPSGQAHIAYRGVCYGVFIKWFLGQATTIGNVEARLDKYPTEYGWISSAQANVSDDCNPVAVIADVLLNTRHGIGIDPARMNTAEMEVAMDVVKAEDIGVSPIITSARTARQIVSDALDHIDGYVRVGEDGRFSIRLIRKDTPVDIGVLTEEDITDLPARPMRDWSQTRGTTRVTYSNQLRYYDDDSVSWRDLGNYRIGGETSAQTLDRPWVTRQAVARQLAGAAGVAAALPAGEIKLKVKRQSVSPNDIGRRYALSYAPMGISGLVVRVTDQSFGGVESRVVDVTVREERAWVNGAHYGVTDDTPEDSDEMTANDSTHQEVIELPYALCLPDNTGEYPRPCLAALLARADDYATSHRVWRKDSATSSNYTQVGEDNAFAYRGTLVDGYDPGLTLDTEIGMLVDIANTDDDLATLDLDEALQDRMLVFIGEEILSIYRVTVVSAGRYRLYCVRARMGTRQEVHDIGDAVWIVERNTVTPITHGGIKDGQTHTYKLQTLVDAAAVPLDELTPIALTFTARVKRPLPPLNFRRTASATAFWGATDPYTQTYPSTGTLYFRWDHVDQQADDFWVQWRKLKATEWDSGAAYDAMDEVTRNQAQNNLVYLALRDSTGIEPGVTAGWQNYWTLKHDLPTPGTILEIVNPIAGFAIVQTINLGRGVNRWKVAASTITGWLGGHVQFYFNVTSYLKGLRSSQSSIFYLTP